MNKEDFLKRCETLYAMGLADEEVLNLASSWVDAIMRLEGGQLDNFANFLAEEKKRTGNFNGRQTLANDSLGYKIINLIAVLNHPCQKCAEDKNAWHTRTAFCNHK
jgi:hypothetical protein